MQHAQSSEGSEKMRGEKVIVRAFDGEPLVRLIWDVAPKTVYICNEEGYQRLLAGEPWMPIGFPRKDVFQYDPAVAERLTMNWRGDPSIWENLAVWVEESTSPKENC